MPSVPRAPGVPRLSSYTAAVPSLLLADVFSAVRIFGAPIWGIFAISGDPVIIPATQLTQQVLGAVQGISNIASLLRVNIVPVTASMIDFDYARDAPISDYPQEEGAFQTYNKVVLPFDVRLRLAHSGATSTRQAFLNALNELLESIALVDILTPEKSFTGCNCTHIDWRRNASGGVSMIQADVWFKQVREVDSSAPFSNTQQPFAAGQQSIGSVQAQPPSGVVEQQLMVVAGAPF